MKATPRKPPTAAELEILAVLWARGPSTVREVQDALGGEPTIGYTSVLKFLQIMTAKGSVVRDESQRAHVYVANVPATSTKRQLAHDLLRRVFGGSASDLMLHALSGKKASRDEIDRLRRLIDDMERKSR
jgi:predicted transcriptional regulator